jgi:serine protease DegQ
VQASEQIPRNAPAYGKVQGVRVRAVERDSRAFANGLRPGDIITSVNQRAVSELKDFYEIVNREESALLLHVLRGGVWVYMVAK